MNSRSAAALVATGIGLVLVAVLVSRLPSAHFASAQASLLLAAGALVLLVAAATLFAPARRLQRRIFLTPYVERGGAFAVATPEEMRGAVKPVLAAVACLLVAALSTALR